MVCRSSKWLKTKDTKSLQVKTEKDILSLQRKADIDSYVCIRSVMSVTDLKWK